MLSGSPKQHRMLGVVLVPVWWGPLSGEPRLHGWMGKLQWLAGTASTKAWNHVSKMVHRQDQGMLDTIGHLWGNKTQEMRLVGYLFLSWLVWHLTLGLCECWLHIPHHAIHQCSTYLSPDSVTLTSPYAIALCSSMLLFFYANWFHLLLMVLGH